VTRFVSSWSSLWRRRHEALVVDGRGNVVEGATSNVFVVQAGGLKTPPEGAGILPGITRAHVLDAAARLGIAVEERELKPDDLYKAEEVFITSSIREILPVVRVDGRAVGRGMPGHVSRQLHRAFRVAVGFGTEPMPWE
jgi:branched-chain amino acid aminotransferase